MKSYILHEHTLWYFSAEEDEWFENPIGYTEEEIAYIYGKYNTPPMSRFKYCMLINEETVKAFSVELMYHNDLYYAKAEPELTDRQFDAKMDFLLMIEKKHPDLLFPDSATQQVGH